MNDRLMPEGAASSSDMPGAPAAVEVPEITTNEAFKQHCTELSGICIVAALNPSGPDFAAQRDTLQVKPSGPHCGCMLSAWACLGCAGKILNVKLNVILSRMRLWSTGPSHVACLMLYILCQGCSKAFKSVAVCKVCRQYHHRMHRTADWPLLAAQKHVIQGMSDHVCHTQLVCRA